MRLKKLFLVLIFITSFMLVCALLQPNIVIDKDEIDLNSNDFPSVNAYNCFGSLSKYINVENNIDNKIIGEYHIHSKVKYLFYNFKKSFIVHVVDNVNPNISLNGERESYVCPGKDYVEEGYTASDNYDGDITDNVIVDKQNDLIKYSVRDKSGNYSEIERKIIFIDREEPIIELKGGNDIYIYKDNKYIETGYTASDNCDGDITNKVISTGTVDTTKVGTYTINYEVIDSSNNKTSIKRNVTVRERPIYYGDGIIYLTFDDGPSNLTGKILDILDEEDIKATFFVTKGGEYVKRAYNSGHTIALHTYSHNYSYVYASESNYFADLNNVSNSVYNTIGIRPNIIRFPGGSSNTISRNYNKGIMSRLVNDVTNRGYIYFDWNIDSNDAGGDGYNSNKIYNNVINGLSHNKTNVVLMHDSSSHSRSADALRDIIKYGKNNGYSFKAISSNTPVVRHGVNN